MNNGSIFASGDDATQAPRVRARAAAALVAALAACPAAAFAQGWPSKPIRFVMTAPAGSSIDVLGRVLADRLKDRLGQNIVVDNQPAAGGTVGTNIVVRATADGHTIGISFNGPLAFAPHLYSKLPYDPQRDLAAVVLTTSQPNVLAVAADVPAGSVRELVDLARTRAGRINYASVGNGSSSHLTMELFRTMGGFEAVHVPFNGSPPALNALATGDAQMLFAVPTAITPLAKAGKVKMLAVTSARRWALLPELPTLAEGGLAGFEALAWNGVIAPAGVPREVVAKLNREIVDALAAAEVRARLHAAGLEPAGGSPEAFAELIRAEGRKWAPIILRTGARID